MAFKKQIYEFKILLLVLIGIPLITSTNIDCGGKSFHCVDSTHFMICVDLGGGVSSTVDDFVIPCPPPTVCQGTNHFECEFPALTTPLPVPPSDITNEIGTTQQWEAISVTTIFPTNVSEEHLDLKYVDGTSVTLAGVTTDISIQTTPIFNVSESVTENNVIITTESIKESTVFTKANNGNVLNIDANTTIISLGESQTTFNQTEAYAVSGSSTIATDTTISSVMSQNPIVNETNINLEDNQTQLNITETKITADFPTIPTQTIVSAMTDNPITLATSSNIDSNVNTETNIMLDSATEISTTINEFLLPNIMDNLTTTVRIEDIYMTTSTPDSVTILSENAVNSMPVQAEIVTAPSTMGEVRTTVDPFNHISEKVSSKSIIDTTASVYENGIENDVITTTESLMYETTVFTQLIKSTNRTNTLLINVTGIDGNETASNNTVVSQINSKYAATEGIGTILTNIPGINEAPDTPTTEVIITNTQTYLKDTNYVPESVTDFGNDRPIKSTTLVSTKDILDSGVAPTTDILTTTPTELVYELSTVTASGDLTVTENVLPTISSIIVTNSNLATVGNISTGTPNPTTEAFTSITTEPTTISDLPHSEIVAMLVSTTASTSTKLNESSMADKTKILEIYETTTMASIDNKNELLTTTDNIIIPTGNTVIPQTTIISNGTTENNIMDLDNIIRNKSKQTDEVTSNPFYKGTVMSSSSSDLDQITVEAAETTIPVIKIDLNTDVTDVPAMIVTNSPDLNPIINEAVDTTKSVIKIDLNTEVTNVPAMIVTNSPDLNPIINEAVDTTKSVIKIDLNTEVTDVPAMIVTNSPDLDSITDEAVDTTKSVIKLDLNTEVTDVPATIVTNSPITIQNKTALNQTQQTEIRQPNLSSNENTTKHWSDSTVVEASTSATTAYENIIEHKTVPIEMTTEHSDITNISGQRLNLNETFITTTSNPKDLELSTLSLEAASHITSNVLNILENNVSSISPKVEESVTEAIKLKTENSLIQSIYDSVVNSFTKTTNNSMLTLDSLSTTTSAYGTSTKSNETSGNKIAFPVTSQIHSIDNRSEIETTTSPTNEETILSTADNFRNLSQGIVATDVNLSDASTSTADKIYSSPNNLFTANPNVEILSQNSTEIILMSVPTQGKSESISTLNANSLTHTEDFILTTSMYLPENTSSKPIMKDPLEDISHLQENVTTEEISSVVSKNDLFNESSLAAIIVSPEKRNLTNERDIFTQVTLDSSSSLTVQGQVEGIDTSTAVKDLASSSDQKQYDLADKSKQSQNTFETVTRSHNSEFITANPILKHTSQFDERLTAKDLNIEYNINNPSQNAILHNVPSIEEAVGIPLNTTEFTINKSDEIRLPAENHSFITTTAQSIVRENKNVSTTPDKMIILTINSDGSASYASENVSLNRQTQAVQSVITEPDDVIENLVTKNDNGISMTVKTEKSSTDNLNKDLVDSQPHITPIIGTVNTMMPNEEGILMTGSNNPISSFGNISPKEGTVEITTSLPTKQLSINKPQIVLVSNPTQGEVIVTTVKPNEDGKTITGLDKQTSNKTQAESSLVNRPQMGVENSPIEGKVIEHTVRPNEDVKTITESNKSMSSLINVQPAASKDAINKTTSSIGFNGITSNVVESMFTSERTVPNEIYQKTTGHNVEEPQRNNTVVETQENTETTTLAKSPIYQDITLNASNDQATITELQNATGIPTLEEDNTQITSNRDIKQVTDSSIPTSIISIALTGGANDEAQLKTTISSLTSNKQHITRDFLTTITPIAGTILGWDSKLDSLATSNINNREVSTMSSFTENTLNGDILIHTSPQKASTVKETMVQSVNKNNSHGINATVATDKTEGLDNSTMDLQSQNEAINKTSMTVKETMLQSVNKNNSHGINATVPTDKTEGLDNSTMDLQSQNEAINNISMIGHKQVTIQQSSTNKDGSTRGNVEISTQGNLNDAKGQPVTESMNPQVKDDAKSSSIFDIITSASSYVPNVDSSTMSSDINAQITFSKSKLTHGTIRPPDNEENEKFKTSEVGQTSTQSMGTIAMVTKENKKVNNVATTTMHFNTATETLNIAQQKPLDDVTNSYVLNNINENRSNLAHTENTFIIPPRQVTNSQNADKISNAPTSQYTEVTPTKMGVTLQTEITTSRSIQKTSSKPNNTIATKITTKSLATTERSSLKPTTMTNARVNSNQQKAVTTKPNFTCKDHIRGRYSDVDNCKKFYICIGRQEPIIGLCPANTVFSEVKTQCTKNLSHCIRNNQFKCVSEGRFSDYLQQNVYYICVENRMHNFVRFKFQCQTGYYLNKTSVRCSKNPEVVNLSSSVDISKSTFEKKSKEETKSKKEDDFECEKEGKFANENNCRRYYVCKKTNRSEEFRRRIKKCDSDEVFHKEKKKCVDAESYEC